MIELLFETIIVKETSHYLHPFPPCNQQSLESCVCFSGFVGQDCSQVITAGTGIWETLSSVTDLNLTCSHLARMGHTMVEAHGNLIVFGGYSLSHGLLSDILSFNLTTSVWSCLIPDQGLGSLPTARFLHSAVFYKVSNFAFNNIILSRNTCKEMQATF